MGLKIILFIGQAYTKYFQQSPWFRIGASKEAIKYKLNYKTQDRKINVATIYNIFERKKLIDIYVFNMLSKNIVTAVC